MNSLVHWSRINASVLAVLVTLGVAVLLVCCLECSNCSCRRKTISFIATRCKELVPFPSTDQPEERQGNPCLFPNVP